MSNKMSSRDSMETLPAGDPDTSIGTVDGRSDVKRAALKKNVEDTNQDGLYQQLGSQSFETVFNVKNTMCNFPVTLVTYEGKIKKKGSEPEKNVPPLTYMVFEPQIEWNKKWLTFNFVEPEKRKGAKVASMPDTYTNTEYYYCLPKSVARSVQYRNMYVDTNKATYKNLTSDDLKEQFTVFKCNWEVADQCDYNEHCRKMHGVIPGDLRMETNISVDPKIPFKLNNAMTIVQLGNGDHWAILNNWFTKAVACEVISKSIKKAATDVIEDRKQETA